MRSARRHAWDLSPADARALQAELAGEVVTRDDFGAIARVAGIDIGFEDQGRITRAAVVVLRLADLAPLDQALVRRPTSFPYVPGLLSFREIPAAVQALEALRAVPDLLVCDGQGFAHPRRFGLACHLGWLLDRPCIGVAKSRLIGAYEEPGPERGAWTPLLDGPEVIGAALRTRTRTKPVFVSVGHRMSLRSAVAFTLSLSGRYRLPETTRRAHRLASPTRAATDATRRR